MRFDPDALRINAAIYSIVVANRDLTVAKHTGSARVIEQAQRTLQGAVDVARDLDVEWGRIGAALGIARGNAYQRFRRKPCASWSATAATPPGNASRRDQRFPDSPCHHRQG
jgi:hypothetical protein